MKKIFIAAIIVLSILSGCKKYENPPQDDGFSNGVITGVDLRMCDCCGGWYIKIDTVQYRFFDIPDSLHFSLDNAVYPIPVKLKWKLKEQPCMGDLIDVLQIQKR